MTYFGYATIDENDQVVPTDNFDSYIKWAEENKARYDLKTEIGLVVVSTVFLGMSHPGGWFETMVFNGPDGGTVGTSEDDDSFQMRYETWEEAKAGHLKVCEMARSVRLLEAK